MDSLHLDPMRILRGHLLAEAKRSIVRMTFGNRSTFEVPSSQDVGTTYRVFMDEDNSWVCSGCPDFKERQLPCKHIFEVLFTFFPEIAPAVPFDLLKEIRNSGPMYENARRFPLEKWTYDEGLSEPARRDLALTNQHKHVLALLCDLRVRLDEIFPKRSGAGRYQMTAGEKVLAMVWRSQRGDSIRKFDYELDQLVAQKIIGAKRCKATFIKYYADPETMVYLLEAYRIVISVFRLMETDVIIDSTGYSPFYVANWLDYKWNNQSGRPGTQWFKVHAMIGRISKAILGYCLTPSSGEGTGDSSSMKPLLEWLVRNDFDNRRYVIADNIYLVTPCFEAARSARMRLIGPTRGRNFNDNGVPRPYIEDMVDFAKQFPGEFDYLTRKRSSIEGVFSCEKREDPRIAAIGSQAERAAGDLQGMYVSRQNEMLIKIIRQVLHCTVTQMYLRDRPGISYTKGSVFSEIREFSPVSSVMPMPRELAQLPSSGLYGLPRA